MPVALPILQAMLLLFVQRLNYDARVCCLYFAGIGVGFAGGLIGVAACGNCASADGFGGFIGHAYGGRGCADGGCAHHRSGGDNGAASLDQAAEQDKKSQYWFHCVVSAERAVIVG